MGNKIYFETMGCDKNTADSSVLMGLAEQNGYQQTQNIQEADWIVVNTCGFILPAKEESIAAILDAIAYKEDNKKLKVLVHGCLVEKYRDELEESIPEVDVFFGVYGLMDIIEQMKSMDGRMEQNALNHQKPVGQLPYVRKIDSKTAYMKIADGCDTRCTYCAIPDIKGAYKSREWSELIEEAWDLAKQGVEELILVAQDTTAYGKDLIPKTSLTWLLKQLVQVSGLRWIRLLYAYPDLIDEDLIKIMVAEPKICHYLDIPFQHGNDQVLRRMGRKQTVKSIYTLVTMIRNICPDMTIRSTFITGFPQETEEEFEDLLLLLSSLKLNWVGAFTYSQEEGTPAAVMKNQIDEEIKGKRYNRLMATQQSVTKDWLHDWVGETLEVLIDEITEDHQASGRTRFMAPDIDGVVTFLAPTSLHVGDFVRVNITDATEYDLIGDYCDDHIQ